MRNKLGFKEFNAKLFEWHKTNYRAMSWRNTHDPYRILISEIMLQQTQVDRVRKKYKEFLYKFPNIQTLASAPLGDVLRVWSGLGYNRRAKYLHKLAQIVAQEHNGKFPNDFSSLVSLPGVGISTAGALLAFAFKEDTPMIDTNIRRILVRCFYKNKEIPNDKVLYAFAQEIIPKGKGREWNYAMLDLGATYCTARNHSDKCPLILFHGKVADFIYKKPQSQFKGSVRFYRGKILKLLIDHQHLTLRNIQKEIINDQNLLLSILERLQSEGIIKKNKDRYFLSD